MNWINTLLQGADGSPSTMRVAVLIIIGGIVFEHVWATVHGTSQTWDWGQVATIVGTLAAKATQAKFEIGGVPAAPPAAPPVVKP